MPLRSWVRRLERRSKKGLASYPLVDGSRFYYDPVEAYSDFVVYCYRLSCGEEAEVPEAYRMLEKAADPLAAVDTLRVARPDLAPHTIDDVFDIEHLAAHRELVARDEALEPAEDLSE